MTNKPLPSAGDPPVIVTTFPRSVRVIEHTLIPLKDGTRLAALEVLERRFRYMDGTRAPSAPFP